MYEFFLVEQNVSGISAILLPRTSMYFGFETSKLNYVWMLYSLPNLPVTYFELTAESEK